MTLKDLLVHVDSKGTCGPAVDIAMSLAERHDAHVVGLGIRAPLGVPIYAEVQLPDSIFDILKEREDTRLTEARDAFMSRAARAGRGERAEWREDAGSPDYVLGLHARYSDLAIVPQSKAEATDHRFLEVAEDVLLGAGRPIMIVPADGAAPTAGNSVLVAWNGSREAARAVADAMPILEAANSVEVFVVKDTDIGALPGADIAAHLSRHGVTVDVHAVDAGSDSAGDLLLARVADKGADLVVMGAYGHSRFHEFVMGGVTRQMLREMTVPVLMSH